jgi:hypothetical protein
MAITTHGGTTDAADKPAGVVPIVSSAVLGVLRERFGERARLCEYYKQECITKGWKHEAHEAEVRKGIWLCAAGMVFQEECTPNDALCSPGVGAGEAHNKL